MALIQPLDFQTIFVNYFSGSMQIFFWVSLVFFAWLGAKFRMTNVVFLVLMIAYILFMGKWIRLPLVLLVVVLIGLLIFWILSKSGKE